MAMEMLHCNLSILFLLTAATLYGCSKPADQRAAELRERAKKYNHEHDDANALLAIEEALKASPDDPRLWEDKALYLWNLYVDEDSTRLLKFYDEALIRRIGRPAYWHFLKAAVLHDLSTKWDGDPLAIRAVDARGIEESLRELLIAGEMEPNLMVVAAEEEWTPVDWDEQFAALLDKREYLNRFSK